MDCGYVASADRPKAGTDDFSNRIRREQLERRLILALIAGCAAWTPAAHAAARPPALRRLRLVNVHTGENFEGAYRNDQGPINRVIDELCIFLRDHHSGEK